LAAGDWLVYTLSMYTETLKTLLIKHNMLPCTLADMMVLIMF